MKKSSDICVNLKSVKGVSLIETLIVISVVMIISAGIATLILNLQKEQRKQTLLQNLTQIQSRIENLIKNDTSWQNTVQDSASNPSFECLRQRKKCDGSAATGIAGNYVDATANTTFVNLSAANQIVLKDGANNIFYDGRQTTNTNGFTETGTTCTGFSYSGSGNDQCPIGYVINWRAMSTDDTPQLLISAKLIFNPSDSYPFKKLINAYLSSATYGKYDVKVARTANSLAKGFIVTVPFVAAAGSCMTAGYGTCSTSAVFTNYSGYSEASADGGSDPYDLVDAVSSSSIRIKAVGTYRCTVFTSAFAVDTVRTELYRTSPAPATTLAFQQSFASTNLLNYANISFTGLVDITAANTDVIIRQRCQSLPSSGPPGMYPMPNVDYCALGFADPLSYGPGKMLSKATLNCIKVE